jgi:hypothetical protein
VDVTSVSRAGRLARRFDEALPDADYDASRLETESLVNLGLDVGDVRLSGYAGAAAASYLDRSVGQDLTRTALLAGVRANLQLHRSWGSRGGPLQLDRLRHVVDLDAGFEGRFFDSHRSAEVPFFDGVDAEDERSAAVLRVRNRLQTRRPEGGTRNLVDLELAWKHYVNEAGPYGQRSPGVIEAWLKGEPRERLYVAGEAVFDLGRDDFRRGFAGVGTRPFERVAVFGGFRYSRGESAAPLVDVSWRWSERYGLTFLESYDLRSNENRVRLLFRRHSPDHVIVFGVSARNDAFDFQIAFEPVVGAVSGLDIESFNEEPGLDVWGAFP